MASEHIANRSGHIAAKFAWFAAICAATRPRWTTECAITRRRFAHAIVAIWRRRVAFVSTRAAIVDVIVEIRACTSATREIAETTRTTTRTGRSARTGRTARAAGAPCPAFAARAHGTAISARASRPGRTRGGLPTTLPAGSYIGAAAGNGQAHQTEKENVVLHEIDGTTTSRKTTNGLSEQRMYAGRIGQNGDGVTFR